jgi:uncharacterized protein (TIGR03437 family)
LLRGNVKLFFFALVWLGQIFSSRAFAQGLSLSATSLVFSAFAGGDAPASQSFGVTSTGDQALPYSLRVDGDSWISARPAEGLTPARIQVSVDQTGLGAGAYSAKVIVSSAGVQDSIVPVTFTVGASPAALDVSPTFARFETSQGSSDPLEQALFIRNAGGGGPMNFQASVSTDSGWLTVAPAQGQTTRNSPAVVSMTVNPAGLAKGVYRGVVHLDSGGGSADIPVSLVVGTPGPALGLNFTGLLFQARQGNGNSNTRNVLVLNIGTGTSNWQTELLSGSEWLSLSNASARGQATPENASRLALTANPGTLDPGVYYALIRLSDPQAINSPIYFTAVLQITGADVPPSPDPTPQGLFFVSESGAPPPATQPFRVFVSSNMPVPFQASVSTVDGADWLSIDRTSGVTSTQSTSVLNVTADASKLDPGIYNGDVTVALPNHVIRTTNITMVVPNPGTALSAKGKSAAGCAPSQMSLTQTGLVNSFDAPAGWPETLIVRLADDCGGPVLDADMVSTFSNGDPPLVMKLTNPQVGLYSATWSPRVTAAQVRVTARATHPILGSATTEIIGGVSPNKAPILSANGTLANANPVPGAPLAPGSIAQVTGSFLTASNLDAPGTPLPTSLNGTSVLIGAEEAPVFFVSPDNVRIQIPTDLETGREHSVIVVANGAYTIPDTITLAPAQPGIETNADNVVVGQDGSSILSATLPAHAGDAITIFAEGMGATAGFVQSGTVASGPDPVQIPPSVTINGEAAQITYAGLAPGFIGLYQIDLQIPANAPAGALGIVVMQNGVASNSAILPVR